MQINFTRKVDFNLLSTCKGGMDNFKKNLVLK